MGRESYKTLFRGEDLSLNNGKVDLSLVEPTGVDRSVDEYGVRPLGTERVGSLLTAMSGTVALAHVLGLGGTRGAGVIAAVAAIPGPGWAIAAGFVVVGAAVRWISRETRKDKVIQEMKRAHVWS